MKSRLDTLKVNISPVGGIAVWWLALTVMIAAPAFSQMPYNNPVTLTRLQEIGRLSRREQLATDVQRELLGWHLYNVEHYRLAKSGSVILQSNLVKLGPQAWPTQDAPIRDVTARPYGTGSHTLLLNPNRTAPSTMSDKVWEFPPPADIFCGSESACWEEMQHALLGQYALDEVDLAVWQPYLRWVTGYAQENREHVFIEYAMHTYEWLNALSSFEREARKAYAEELRHEKAGVRINFEIQHYIWREAFNRWNALWNRFVWDQAANRSRLMPLTGPLRARYWAAAGVRMPTHDQVRNFYLTGGLTDDPNPATNRGSKIQVPEWVMRPLVRSRLVHIQHTPDNPKPVTRPADPVKGIPERLECRFGVEVIDHYNPLRRAIQGGVNNPVMRGKLTVFVRSPVLPEPEVKIEVKAGGRVLSGGRVRDGYYGVQLDLATAYREALLGDTPTADDWWQALTTAVQPLTFEIAFLRGNPSEAVGRRAYQLAILFEDMDDTTGPALYEKSQAVFFIEFEGRGQDKTTTAAAPVQPTVPAPAGPCWVLTKHWADTKTDTREHRSKVEDELMGGVCEISTKTLLRGAGADSLTYSYIWEQSAEKPVKIKISGLDGVRYLVKPARIQAQAEREHTWTVPPNFLTVGKKLPFSVTVKTDGSYARVEPEEADGNEAALYTRKVYKQGVTKASLRLSKTSAAPGASPPGYDLYGIETDATDGTRTREFEVPAYDALYPLLEIVVTAGEPQHFFVDYTYTFQYSWQDAPPPPPPPDDDIIDREKTPPKKQDPLIDNEPDEEEEPPEYETASAGMRTFWYTHPSGDWRIRISGVWGVGEKSPDPQFDTLATPGGSYELQVQRDFQEFSGSAADTLQEQQRRTLATDPGSTAAGMSVGTAPGILATFPPDEEGLKAWNVFFAQAGRQYMVRIAGGEKPDQGLAILGNIVFLRQETDATGTGDKAPTTILRDCVVDETRALSPRQISNLRIVLLTLKVAHGVELGVVILGPTGQDEAARLADVYRAKMVEAKVLPENSGLLLYAGTGAMEYSRDKRLDPKVPAALVKQAWEETATIKELPERAAAQLRLLKKLLDARKQ